MVLRNAHRALAGRPVRHPRAGGARTMTASLDPGAVTIDVTVADRHVRSVAIGSTRPVQVIRLFVGRPVEDVPALAERLFSLCGRAHSVAASRAGAVALGWPVDNARRTAETNGLAAERIAETLRATVLGGSVADADSIDAETAMLLRECLSAARTLMMHGLSNGRLGPANGPALVTRLAQAVHGLGLPLAGAEFTPDPHTLIGRLLREAEAETAFRARTPDMLTQADDVAVIEALRAQGESFAAAPNLPGRVVETGAYARHWQSTASAPTTFAARLFARLLDMAECLELLQAAVAVGIAPQDDPVHCKMTGPREGFAALESPRGRLYHWLQANAERQIVGYAIVAPTEWNFHRRGPLVEALLGARIGSGEDACRRVSRLVAVFDPCVSFDVHLAETADA